MTLDLAYWQRLGAQLGWQNNFRDPIHNQHDHKPRERGYVHYFIIHHTATANEALAADLFLDGGRTVTAQWLLCTDGKFRPCVPLSERAYTSSSWLDDIADTVETVNSTGPDTYGMADLSIMALAIMAVWKFRNGRLASLTRTHIVGHYEVLGISGSGYATSCPGPNTTEADRRLDLVTELAQAIDKGLLGPHISFHEEDIMPAFYRNPKGGIAYQREPNTPLIPIDLPTWQGYAANGAKYVDLSQTAWDGLAAKFGTAAKPEPTGGTVSIGDIQVPPFAFDYEAAAAANAKAFFDEQARRVAS